MLLKMYSLLNRVFAIFGPQATDDPGTGGIDVPSGFPWENGTNTNAWGQLIHDFFGNEGSGGLKKFILIIGVISMILCGLQMIMSSDSKTYDLAKQWLNNIVIGTAIAYILISIMF